MCSVHRIRCSEARTIFQFSNKRTCLLFQAVLHTSLMALVSLRKHWITPPQTHDVCMLSTLTPFQVPSQANCKRHYSALYWQMLFQTRGLQQVVSTVSYQVQHHMLYTDLPLCHDQSLVLPAVVQSVFLLPGNDMNLMETIVNWQKLRWNS